MNSMEITSNVLDVIWRIILCLFTTYIYYGGPGRPASSTPLCWLPELNSSCLNHSTPGQQLSQQLKSNFSTCTLQQQLLPGSTADVLPYCFTDVYNTTQPEPGAVPRLHLSNINNTVERGSNDNIITLVHGSTALHRYKHTDTPTSCTPSANLLSWDQLVLVWRRRIRSLGKQPRLGILITILLLSAGVEPNPGPRFGFFNTGSAVHKAALIQDIMGEHKLDILAVNETWIVTDDPDAIKFQMTPPGFSIEHTHRPGATPRNRGGRASHHTQEQHQSPTMQKYRQKTTNIF